MPKYYIQSGTLSIIFSTSKKPYEAACTAIHEINENDELDEYMYIDERGYRNYVTAKSGTIVIPTDEILRREGYIK